MTLIPTPLCPAPYPTFLKREFMPENYSNPLELSEIEKLQLVYLAENAKVEIIGVWIE